MTVKELKEALNNCSDDMNVVLATASDEFVNLDYLRFSSINGVYYVIPSSYDK